MTVREVRDNGVKWKWRGGLRENKGEWDIHVKKNGKDRIDIHSLALNHTGSHKVTFSKIPIKAK